MKFSLLTAIYNTSPFLDECINSVLEQKYKNWELILVDDLSTDKSLKIAKTYANKYKNIKVVESDQSKRFYGGVCAEALKHATGDLCGILDGDDAIKPESIETIVKAYAKYTQVGFMWTQHDWCDSDLKRYRNGLSSSPKKVTLYFSEENFKHTYSHWRTFRTSLRDKGTIFRNIPCTVDKDMGYHLEELALGGFLPISLYRYRYHKNNLSHKGGQKQMWKEIREYHRHRRPKFISREISL